MMKTMIFIIYFYEHHIYYEVLSIIITQTDFKYFPIGLTTAGVPT